MQSVLTDPGQITHMRLMGSRPGSGLVLLSAILVPTLASSTASANPIPGPFDIMHYIAFINFPFNGLILLYIVNLAHIRREELAFGPALFLRTFFLSVGVITFTGAFLDSLLIYSHPLYLFLFAVIVGLVAGGVSHRYLGLGPRMVAITVSSFAVINLTVWLMLISIASTTDLDIVSVVERWWYLLGCYTLLVVLAVVFAMTRLRTTRVVPLSPYTGERGLERVDRGPYWEQRHKVLGRRTLVELLSLCLATFAVAVLVPLMST